MTASLIGLVIVTHGKLATEFVSVLEHVVGKQKQITAICIEPEDNMEQRREDIVAAIDQVNGDKGVIVVTDMFGGTPSNLAISIMTQRPIEVLAGANVPMLVKLASVRDKLSLKEAAEQGRDAGQKYINVASQLLG
jgi:PTS system mannose-specific IIA component